MTHALVASRPACASLGCMSGDIERAISDLLCDAIKAGDPKRQALCEVALGIGSGWDAPRKRRQQAVEECARVLGKRGG